MSEELPIRLPERLLLLSQQAGRMRAALQKLPDRVGADVLEGLASLEAALFEISRQVTAVEEEHTKLLALAGTTQAVNSSLDLDEVLQLVMDTIVRLTEAERGFLMLRNAQGEMVIRVARNWEQESINPADFAISRTVLSRVVQSGEAVLTTNAQQDPRFGGHESIVAYSLRSILCVPLKVRTELIGVIYADNRIRAGIFREPERDLLAVFADQAAIAIENARLFASVRHSLAEVTGLKNLMDNVFASIASGVLTVDDREQILLCNRAAEAILGQNSADLVGRRLQDALPALAREIRRPIASVRETDLPVVGLEFTQVRPGRSPLEWRLNLSPLKDADQTTRGVAIVLDDLTERRHLEAQHRLLERMVSPAVIEQMDPDSLQMVGKRRELTILFADLRDFTPYSETRTPEELVAVLNRYLAAGVEAVLAEDGTVDKFLGDAVMAWFNAPLPQPDHTLRAVRAALGLKAAVAGLHSRFPRKYRFTLAWGSTPGRRSWAGSAPRSAWSSQRSAMRSTRPCASRNMPPPARS
jgi:PAS domain S-box-containing protein